MQPLTSSKETSSRATMSLVHSDAKVRSSTRVLPTTSKDDGLQLTSFTTFWMVNSKAILVDQSTVPVVAGSSVVEWSSPSIHPYRSSSVSSGMNLSTVKLTASEASPSDLSILADARMVTLDMTNTSKYFPLESKTDLDSSTVAFGATGMSSAKEEKQKAVVNSGWTGYEVETIAKKTSRDVTIRIGMASTDDFTIESKIQFATDTSSDEQATSIGRNLDNGVTTVEKYQTIANAKEVDAAGLVTGTLSKMADGNPLISSTELFTSLVGIVSETSVVGEIQQSSPSMMISVESAVGLNKKEDKLDSARLQQGFKMNSQDPMLSMSDSMNYYFS